jgi:hypothetical protein
MLSSGLLGKNLCNEIDRRIGAGENSGAIMPQHKHVALLMIFSKTNID